LDTQQFYTSTIDWESPLARISKSKRRGGTLPEPTGPQVPFKDSIMKRFANRTILALYTLAALPVLAQTTTTTALPTYDTRTRELRIPCLQVNGVVVRGTTVEDAKYDVVMKQRGQSSNWEITFANPGCAGNMPAADPVPAGS
jgi:hypothetical protein